MDKLLKNFIDSFKIHVGTKTVDIVLHQFLEKVYEFNFKALHTIGERRQDLDLDETVSCEDATSQMMITLESEREVIEKMIEENKDKGLDNLLRSRLDELEDLIGTAKGFEKEEKEE